MARKDVEAILRRWPVPTKPVYEYDVDGTPHIVEYVPLRDPLTDDEIAALMEAPIGIHGGSLAGAVRARRSREAEDWARQFVGEPPLETPDDLDTVGRGAGPPDAPDLQGDD